MNIKLVCRSALTTLFATSLIACASTEPHLGAEISTVEDGNGVSVTQAESRRLLENGKIAGDQATLIDVVSTVSRIDQKARTFTLRTPAGESVDLIAGPELRNFNQVRVGDRVKAQYLVSLSFEVRKPTPEELAASGKSLDVGARARLGAMPAGGAATGTVHVASVTSIDKKAGTVTLKDMATSEETVIKAKYPENLSYVRSGDSVVITSLEALATSVERVK